MRLRIVDDHTVAHDGLRTTPGRDPDVEPGGETFEALRPNLSRPISAGR